MLSVMPLAANPLSPLDVDATLDDDDSELPPSSGETASGDEDRLDVREDDQVGSEVLGIGGQAEVLLGHQASLQREVAIKRLSPHQRSASARRRLIDEARLTGGLEHPNIVPIHDLRVDRQGWPFLVLKRVHGTTWRQELDDEHRKKTDAGPLSGAALRRHVRVLLLVCQAVHFAHLRGVLHLDLKPANVMLGDHGEVYVVDWGTALRFARPGATLPAVSQVRGTLLYASPEAMGASAEAVLGPRSDVYSLGATLVHVILGKPPHAGKQVDEVLRLIGEGGGCPEALGVRGELGEIIRKALSMRPDDRFASVDELRRELETWLEHEGAATLTARGMDRLQWLRELSGSRHVPPELAALHDAFVECRFALEESLRLWPEQPDAEEALEQAREVMVRAALSVGNAHLARVHLVSMKTRPQALEGQLLELERSRSVDERELRTLREAAKDDDLSSHSLARKRYVLRLGVGLFFVQALAWRLLGEPPRLTYAPVLPSIIGVLVGYPLLLFWISRRIPINRGIMLLIRHSMLVILLAILPVPIAWATGQSPVHCLIVSLCAVGAANLAAGNALERHFGWLGLSHLTAALLVYLFPVQFAPILVFFGPASLIFLARMGVVDSRRQG
jgi:serine/threonine-protein kinase